MYTSIPTNKLPTIIDSACNNNFIEENLKRDVIKLSKIIIDQNCFQLKDKTYLQHKGLAVVAPTSSIFSEFYLQYLENAKIYNLLINYNIAGYFCYMDSILIIYNESTTNIEELLNYFNNLMPKLKFTLEKGIQCKINFLDIKIRRESNNFSIEIYKKTNLYRLHHSK